VPELVFNESKSKIVRNLLLYGLGTAAFTGAAFLIRGPTNIKFVILAGFFGLMTAYFLFKLGSGAKELLRVEANGLVLGGGTRISWRDIERVEVAPSHTPAFMEVQIISNGKVVHRINEITLPITALDLKLQIERQRRAARET
jgi:hypothetical protein